MRNYCGIYQILFSDGSCYIGSTKGRFKKRFISHKSLMVCNKAPKLLQEQYNLLGEPLFNILCECNMDMLSLKEKDFIKFIKPKLNINLLKTH